MKATSSVAAANFIGYNQVDQKSTTCGACHTDPQNEWQGTRHARAWATLDSLPDGQAQEFCFECHTISARGNAATDPNVAYTSTKDMRYSDVQCESCHGAGLEHIDNPGATQPLPTLKAGADLTDGCGECHNGEHHPFVEEWERSGHGTMTAWSPTGPQTNPSCQGCHTGQGALGAMGVDAGSNYLEKGKVATDPLKITCGICHDPHNATNPRQLRLRIDIADEKQNLCMSCHHKRGEPDLGTGNTTTRGAHSPEGPMLLGEAGWWPPGMPTGGLDKIVSTHGTGANPRLCAGCHVEQYEVTDKETGAFKLNVVGHHFTAIPCVDANGIPVSTDCGTDLTKRRFTACATSGCHASQDQARSAFVTATNRIVNLNNQLKALLAKVPKGEESSTDNRFTVAEGSRFNTTLADKRGSQVHNPFLMEALLVGSIDAVKLTYNVQ